LEYISRACGEDFFRLSPILCEGGSKLGSIIFVHGTGVREESYNDSLARVRANLKRDGLPVAPCPWGISLGAKLNKAGASIPEFQQTHDDNQPLTEEERKIALWAVLYQDPLYELRLFEIRNHRSGDSLPGDLSRLGQPNVFEQLAPKVRSLTADPAVAARARQCRLEKVWEEAIKEVVESPEFQALHHTFDNTTEIRQAVARALIAQSLALKYRNADSISISARDRDQMEELLLLSLGGRDLGAGHWLFEQFMAKPITWYVRRNRGQVSADSFAFAGDILLYQARGQAIRDFIREQIERTAEQTCSPVTLLAHSLGGIACVDLLNERDLSDKVELLITVGSQAPFLYELNALGSLEFGQPLRSHFPARWLNIYDPRDFLSYLAANVFKGPDVINLPPEIKDVRVDNGHPFPQSHSAYWENQEVWEAIRGELR
jgi:pimeloyl-ACP methyl ester carboxylesterase